MSDNLTPLAKVLFEICPTKEKYVEVLKIINEGLKDQVQIMKNTITETADELLDECDAGNNLPEWENAWDKFKNPKIESR